MKLSKLKKIAKKTNGTVFQHIGTTKAYGDKKFKGKSLAIIKYENKKLGKLGAASPCYRIDPVTGERIEVVK